MSKLNITLHRAKELEQLVLDELHLREWFDYHSWDNFIECDESMTHDELRWLEENFTVNVSLKRKTKGKPE